MILAQVVSDAKDPRRDFRRIAQAFIFLLDFYKGFLNEIIGNGLIPYRCQDEFSDSMVVLIMNFQ